MDGTTVNGCTVLVPPVVVSDTLKAVGAAVEPTVNRAVSDVVLVTVTLLTVTPVPATFTVVDPT